MCHELRGKDRSEVARCLERRYDNIGDQPKSDKLPGDACLLRSLAAAVPTDASQSMKGRSAEPALRALVEIEGLLEELRWRSRGHRYS
jgi:hypothetical protein